MSPAYNVPLEPWCFTPKAKDLKTINYILIATLSCECSNNRICIAHKNHYATDNCSQRDRVGRSTSLLLKQLPVSPICNAESNNSYTFIFHNYKMCALITLITFVISKSYIKPLKIFQEASGVCFLSTQPSLKFMLASKVPTVLCEQCIRISHCYCLQALPH